MRKEKPIIVLLNQSNDDEQVMKFLTSINKESFTFFIHHTSKEISKYMTDFPVQEINENKLINSLDGGLDQEVFIILFSKTSSSIFDELKIIKNNGCNIFQVKLQEHYSLIHEEICKVLPINKIVDYIKQKLKSKKDYHLVDDKPIYKILELIAKKTNVSFYQYKKNTIKRRITKRMNTLNIQEINEYLDYIKDNFDELSTLVDSFLIGVTQFFRDASSFSYLYKNIIPKIIYDDKKEIRIWVPGCSTGEEAYTLAILFDFFKTKHKLNKKISIFATDINETAIEQAKKGSYSKDIASDIPLKYLTKYFIEDKNHYQVIPKIKSMITFVKHNLIQDKPYTNIDFISCRNVFIYFSENLQHYVLKLFEFSLNKYSYLFIGKSEVVKHRSLDFISITGTHRIYQHTPSDKKSLFFDNNQLDEPHQINHFRITRQITQKIKEVEKFYLDLLKQVATSCFVINEKNQLIHVFGNAKQFITNYASDFLFKMIPKKLVQIIEPKLEEVKKTNIGIQLDEMMLKINGTEHTFKTVITTLPSLDYQSVYLISFIEKNQIQTLPPIVDYHYNENKSSFISELINELNSTREQFKLINYEYEVTSEELQSTNEELISSNEEMQSSNEELNSMNEELNSLNEELIKLNYKYEQKVEEVTEANDDIINLLQVSKISAIILDHDLNIRRFVDNTMNEFHFTENFIGQSIKLLNHQFQNIDFYKHAKKCFETQVSSRKEIISHILIPYIVLFNPYYSNNELKGVVISLLDITELKQAYHRIERLSYVIQNIHSSVITTDRDGTITYVNPHFTYLTGYNSDEIKGQHIKKIIPSEDFLQNYNLDWQTNKRQVLWRGETQSFKKDGSKFYKNVTMIPVYDEHQQFLYLLIVSEDITEKKKAEAYIQKLAYTDELTKLSNRAYFKHKMQDYLNYSKNNNQKCAILFMDLNSFKDINDSLGHNVGDQLLQQIVERINQIMKEENIFSRFGGDEFILSIPNLKDKKDALDISQEIIEIMKQPFYIKNQAIYTSFSIGIVFYPDHGDTLDELLKNADIAMYNAKTNNTKTELFTYSMHYSIIDRIEMENNIQQAIINKEFTHFYQPIVDINTGKLISIESLLRWQSKDKGLLLPGNFLDLIENSGQIISIGEQTMLESLNKVCSIQHHLKDLFEISFNLSTKQLLNPELVENITQFLKHTDVAPNQIMIEITEHITAEDIKNTAPIFKKLDALGVSFSMDDFGTGYSSLGQLKNYPIKKVKIDKLFVNQIETDDDYHAIVKGIIALSHFMNYKVVAEGVETKSQLEMLKKLDCDEVQGYYVCKPMPYKELLDIIKKNNGYFF